MLLPWDNYVPDLALPDLEQVLQEKSLLFSPTALVLLTTNIYTLRQTPQPIRKSGG